MKFKVIIDGFPLEVDSQDFPYGEVGQAGSLLDIAQGHGVRLNHTCGGVCNCTTCHVHVIQGLETCTPPSPEELNRLKEVFGRQPNSRLACQCIPSGEKEVEVEIP